MSDRFQDLAEFVGKLSPDHQTTSYLDGGIMSSRSHFSTLNLGSAQPHDLPNMLRKIKISESDSDDQLEGGMRKVQTAKNQPHITSESSFTTQQIAL